MSRAIQGLIGAYTSSSFRSRGGRGEERRQKDEWNYLKSRGGSMPRKLAGITLKKALSRVGIGQYRNKRWCHRPHGLSILTDVLLTPPGYMFNYMIQEDNTHYVYSDNEEEKERRMIEEYEEREEEGGDRGFSEDEHEQIWRDIIDERSSDTTFSQTPNGGVRFPTHGANAPFGGGSS